MAGTSGSPDSSIQERLLMGQMDPADAPPGLRHVAGLLQDAGAISPAGPAADDEAMLRVMVVAIASSVAAKTLASPPERRRSRRLAKVFAAATFATLASGGVAAASGDLPDPIQDVVSDAAGIVGVEIPRGKASGHLDKPDKDAVKEADEAGRAGERPEDPGPTDDHGRGSEVSDTAGDPTLEGAEKGACVSDVASAGKSRSGDQHDVSCPPGDEPAEGTSGETNVVPPDEKGGRPEVTPADPAHARSRPEDRAGRAPAGQAPADQGSPEHVPTPNGTPATPKGGRP